MYWTSTPLLLQPQRSKKAAFFILKIKVLPYSYIYSKTYKTITFALFATFCGGKKNKKKIIKNGAGPDNLNLLKFKYETQ